MFRTDIKDKREDLFDKLGGFVSLYQSFQSLTVQNAQEFKGRPGRMLVSDLPLLNGGKAGIEN